MIYIPRVVCILLVTPMLCQNTFYGKAVKAYKVMNHHTVREVEFVAY